MNEQQPIVEQQLSVNEQQQQVWTLARRLTSMTVLLGIAVFISSFFVSGFMQQYLLFGGIGLVVSACFLFALGMLLMLMQEAAGSQEDVNEPAAIS